MEIKIDYYKKRKSDGKILHIRHFKILEEDILRMAKEEVGQPKEEDYEHVDFHVAEVKY